jgi:hypothetical protein
MTAISFRKKRPPEDAVLPDVKVSYLEHQHLLTFVVPCFTGHLQVNVFNRCGRLPWDDPVKRIMYQGQVLQIETHLDEGFPHDKIQRGPVVDQCLGHLVSLDR